MKLVEEVAKTEIPSGYQLVEGLPSCGKFYKSGTKIYSRALKVIELKKLASMDGDNFNDVIRSVLKDSVIGVAVDDIILVDKLYLILWQRANTFGKEKFEVNFVCPECGEESTYGFDMSCVSIKGIPEDCGADVEYKIGEDTVTLDMIRIKDEAMMEHLAEGVDRDIFTMAVRLHTLNGKELKKEEAYNYITNMNPECFMQLVDVMNKADVEVKPNLTVDCKKCGGRVEIPLSFRGNFFLPKYSA